MKKLQEADSNPGVALPMGTCQKVSPLSSGHRLWRINLNMPCFGAGENRSGGSAWSEVQGTTGIRPMDWITSGFRAVRISGRISQGQMVVVKSQW